ncbi:MAG TPA: hypothetical protein VG269_13840 [Tepidisphaeraceae bacterium]|jgi:hypothetical protein|nr:hypothetical protein [Tepidisphaeraceae bacterium]
MAEDSWKRHDADHLMPLNHDWIHVRRRMAAHKVSPVTAPADRKLRARCEMSRLTLLAQKAAVHNALRIMRQNAARNLTARRKLIDVFKRSIELHQIVTGVLPAKVP